MVTRSCRVLVLWLSFLSAPVAVAAAGDAGGSPVAVGTASWRSACAEEAGAGPATCVDLGTRKLGSLTAPALYWHIARLTGPEVEAGVAADEWVVEAAKETWVYTFGPLGATPPAGEPVAAVGPLPLPQGPLYEAWAYLVEMPPGMHGPVHVHGGIEAWYVLGGGQCVETPAGVGVAKAGRSMVTPRSVPMRLTSTGPGPRRALGLVIHDPAVPRTTEPDWRASGLCEDLAPRIAYPGERPATETDEAAELAAAPSAAAVVPPRGRVPDPAPRIATPVPTPAARPAARAEPVAAATPAPAPRVARIAPPPPATPAAGARGHFTYAGIGLGSTIAEVSARHPRSRVVGSYVYVAPEDAHDHVSGIEVPGAAGARARITFGGGTERPRYPSCREIETVIESRYGVPRGVQTFFEEAIRRSDRYWEEAGERLELICFAEGDRLLAEAIVITPAGH